MTEQPPKIRACDVLNWDVLAQIADNTRDQPAKTLIEGLAIFAYDFTSTADEDRRDTMLCEVLRNATDGQSPETAELIIERMATALKTECEKLREFAKENGVRLKRKR